MLHQLFKAKVLKKDLEILLTQALNEDSEYATDKLMEEMAELTQAIIKHRRHRGSKYSNKTLIYHRLEEMAHVQIRLNQLMAVTIGLDYEHRDTFKAYYIVKMDELKEKCKDFVIEKFND